MKKIIFFLHIGLLLCIANAYGMDWNILDTDVSSQSVLLENKYTGTQKTMHKGERLDGGVIAEVKSHSVLIRATYPDETNNGLIIYGLREVRVSKEDCSQQLLLSPEP